MSFSLSIVNDNSIMESAAVVVSAVDDWLDNKLQILNGLPHSAIRFLSTAPDHVHVQNDVHVI